MDSRKPSQSVCIFNALTGGVKGAFGYYDLDYYQNTNRQACDWIEKNVKPIPGKKIVVMSNMSGLDKFLAKDSSWITYGYVRHNERSEKDWDYYIDYPRFLAAEQLQNDKWPPQNTVHVISVRGVPLNAIIQRKSKASIAAYEALQKKDFATAIQLYQQYLLTDTTDENVYANYGIALASIGQLDAAIAALTKATEINPGQSQFFGLLAQLYGAKGDQQHAQQARAAQQTLDMKDLEAQGDAAQSE